MKATKWNYEAPAQVSFTLLLKVNRDIVTGYWHGNVGDEYIAWANLPLRDAAIEKQLIIAGKIRV